MFITNDVFEVDSSAEKPRYLESKVLLDGNESQDNNKPLDTLIVPRYPSKAWVINILGSQNQDILQINDVFEVDSSAEKSVYLESKVLLDGNESSDSFEVDSSAEKSVSLESEVLPDNNESSLT